MMTSRRPSAKLISRATCLSDSVFAVGRLQRQPADRRGDRLGRVGFDDAKRTSIRAALPSLACRRTKSRGIHISIVRCCNCSRRSSPRSGRPGLRRQVGVSQSEPANRPADTCSDPRTVQSTCQPGFGLRVHAAVAHLRVVAEVGGWLKVEPRGRGLAEMAVHELGVIRSRRPRGIRRPRSSPSAMTSTRATVRSNRLPCIHGRAGDADGVQLPAVGPQRRLTRSVARVLPVHDTVCGRRSCVYQRARGESHPPNCTGG